MTRPPIVLVTWVDSSSVGTWVPLDEAIKIDPSPCYSAGWLLHAGDDRVTLALDLELDEDLVGNVMVIPRSAVIAIEELRPAHAAGAGS